jgi:hypothetical protein
MVDPMDSASWAAGESPSSCAKCRPNALLGACTGTEFVVVTSILIDIERLYVELPSESNEVTFFTVISETETLASGKELATTDKMPVRTTRLLEELGSAMTAASCSTDRTQKLSRAAGTILECERK